MPQPLSQNVPSDTKASAAKFAAYWHGLYPQTPPINYLFKHRLHMRWARIHNLPEAKRYATSKAEGDILLHRQNTVIDSLIAKDTPVRVVINSIATDNYLFKAFDLEHAGVYQHDDVSFETFVFDTSWESQTFNPLLIMISEEVMRAFIIGPDCLIAPYDGGMDVILKDPHTCWAFKRQFKDWLSPRADGL
jgi:hypothetical protein